MKIKIEVTEVLSRVVSVDANSIEDAISHVKNMYKTEKIVLDYNDFNQDVIIKEQIKHNNNSYKPYNYGVGSNNSTGIYISKEDMISYHNYKSQVLSDEGKEWHLKMAEIIKKKV